MIFHEVEDFLKSPIECFKLKLVAIYCTFLLMISVYFNAYLLKILTEKKSVLNKYYIVLTILNLIGSITHLPIIILSNLSCGWNFGQIGCNLSAFIVNLVGCSSIYLITMLTLERYYIATNQSDFKQSESTTNKKILISILFGLFWSVTPLLGWSNYILETSFTSCSIEWNTNTWNNLSYIISIFISVYMIPLSVVFYCNYKSYIHIKHVLRKSKQKFNSEKDISWITIIYSVIFFVQWTPYALISIYSTFVDSKHINPLTITIVSIIAKSSMVFSSMYYTYSKRSYSNKKIPKQSFVTKNASILEETKLD